MKIMSEAEWNATHDDFKGLWTIERTDWPNWEKVRDSYMGKRTVMSEGSLLVEGMGLLITQTPPKTKEDTVFLRDIGSALEKKMYENPETFLDWVSVMGEDSIQPVPTKVWHFNDALIQVGIVNGNSEGSLIYVHAQKSRYQPDLLIPLFRIKVLCSPKAAFAEARAVYEFFESSKFMKMVSHT